MSICKVPQEIESNLKMFVRMSTAAPENARRFLKMMVEGKHGALVQSYLTQISKELALTKPAHILPESQFLMGEPHVEKIPRVCFSIVAGMLDESDIKAARCVNTLFLRYFKPEAAEKTERAQIVLTQIRGCTAIASIQTLRRQVAELKECLPQYLGQNKTWTMADVLKLYLPSLKVLDLSQENLTLEDLRELLEAFKTISKTEPPKEIIKMGKQAGVFAVDIPRDDAQLLNDIAAEGKIFSEGEVISDHIDNFWTDVVLKLVRRPNVEVAELLEKFAGRMGLPAEMVFVNHSPDRAIFGEIEVFNLGRQNFELLFQEIKPFLELFCPKLKVLVMKVQIHAPLAEVAAIQQFFLTTDRKDTLVKLQTSADENEYQQFPVLMCQLLSCQRNLQEALSPYPTSSYKVLQLLADCCPDITSLSLYGASLQNDTQDQLDLFTHALKIVGQKCPRIKKMALVYFSERVLKACEGFRSTFEELRELSFFSDSLVLVLSPASLTRFLKSCPFLFSLRFIGEEFIRSGSCNYVVPFLPSCQPCLKEFTHFGILSDFDVWDLVSKCTPLTKLYLSAGQSGLCDEFKDIFILRSLNQKVSQKSASNVDLLKEFALLSHSTKESIFKGIPKDGVVSLASGRKNLMENGLHILKNCNEPYLGYTGSILNQHIKQALEEIGMKLGFNGPMGLMKPVFATSVAMFIINNAVDVLKSLQTNPNLFLSSHFHMKDIFGRALARMEKAKTKILAFPKEYGDAFGIKLAMPKKQSED